MTSLESLFALVPADNATALMAQFQGSMDISRWNTHRVTSLRDAFQGVTIFNSDLDGWDVSEVTNMQVRSLPFAIEGATAGPPPP